MYVCMYVCMYVKCLKWACTEVLYFYLSIISIRVPFPLAMRVLMNNHILSLSNMGGHFQNENTYILSENNEKCASIYKMWTQHNQNSTGFIAD